MLCAIQSTGIVPTPTERKETDESAENVAFQKNLSQKSR
jgi:hypothetical protein